MATSHGDWTRRISAGSAIALAGVVVAVAAWRWPVDPSPDPPPSPPPSAPAPSTPPSTPPSGGPTSTPSGPHRFLTELVPSAGGSFVQRTGTHSLVMKCGTGESDDRDREVTYDVPPSGYRTLTTTLRPTGQRETRIQVSVLTDGVVRTDPVLIAGSSQPISVAVDGIGHLTLRITCDAGAASTTFLDPVLSA